MNQLSWLIYFADVANSVSGWFSFFGWVASIIVIIAIIVFIAASSDHNAEANEAAEVSRACGKIIWAFGPFAAIIVLLTIFVPSKETVYAIAASEVGEEVVQSQAFGRATSALNNWIDRQLADEEPAQPQAEVDHDHEHN